MAGIPSQRNPPTVSSSSPDEEFARCFAEDQDWLVRQPGMAPWSRGLVLLREATEGWVAEYAGRILGQATRPDEPAFRNYQRRLWQCWSYHWRSALAGATGPVDGLRVAERVRAGQGYVGQGRLGGDVFRDVILAEAVLQRDDRATALLHDEYQPFAARLARKYHLRETAAADWWPELFDRLAGYSNPPGKLARYSGRCGLQHWLGTVVRRFLLDRGGRHHGLIATCSPDSAALKGPGTEASPDQALISAECLEHFRELLATALPGLSSDQAVLLHLLFAEGLSGKEAAQVLGKHPGTISRRTAHALERLRDLLENSEATKTQPHHECLSHLLSGAPRLSFGQALLEALRDIAHANEGP